RKEIVKALNDAGADLLMGTDSPQMFNVPGFSLYRELPLMIEAGLTPYEVLLTGTRNVADYASTELGEAGNFGAVAAGNRADLILVEENPLEDLGARILHDPGPSPGHDPSVLQAELQGLVGGEEPAHLEDGERGGHALGSRGADRIGEGARARRVEHDRLPLLVVGEEVGVEVGRAGVGIRHRQGAHGSPAEEPPDPALVHPPVPAPGLEALGGHGPSASRPSIPGT
ncbi:MAG TPA: amidohydrolase family protein, partial [Longimicrobiales bacterium]|nr:amidohydrolase family protein [Longimicrobiales bacterium]